jgi:uncharacterized protein YndB with AHSA1/START domain
MSIPNSTLVIDRETHTIRITRDFTAPSAQIFDAWTQPEHVSAWWDPDGAPLAACDIDLKVGGSFKFVTQAQPEQPFAGIYREIAPPDRLVFETMGSTGRVLLQESVGQTHMTVEIQCRSAEQLAQFLQMGIHEGTAHTLDNLVVYARRWR